MPPIGKATRLSRSPEYGPLYFDLILARDEAGLFPLAAVADEATPAPPAPSAPRVVAESLRNSRRFIPELFFLRDIKDPLSLMDSLQQFYATPRGFIKEVNRRSNGKLNALPNFPGPFRNDDRHTLVNFMPGCFRNYTDNGLGTFYLYPSKCLDSLPTTVRVGSLLLS
jgi:hypothetical protein